MGSISDFLRGTVRVEITGAFPEGLLNAAAQAGIELWDAEQPDAWTLRLSGYENSLGLLSEMALGCGCELAVNERRGGSGNVRFLRRRPGLVVGLILTAALLLLSSLFIWRIDIRGNERLSRGQILRALADSGVDVGCFWPRMDVEKVRGCMLQRLPEIGWMTVNVSGSRAVVVISERLPKPEIYRESGCVDLIAEKDGLIRRISVLAGTPHAEPGQPVTKGQMLIEGRRASLTESGELLRARGTVMAETWTQRDAVCPREEEIKTSAGVARSRFALCFGKQRLNLYFSSGKAIDACDKIISEYTLGVKGLFALPVRIVHERLVPYRTQMGDGCDREAMARHLYSALEQSMQGQILDWHLTEGTHGGLYVLTLRAHCSENIAAAVQRPE